MHGGNTLTVVLSKMYFLYLLTHGPLLFIWLYDLGVQNSLSVSLAGV